MFTDTVPLRPLTPEDMGLLAHLGRLLRARGADILISQHVLLARASDSAERDALGRMLQTHNRESSSSVGIVATNYDDTTLFITRALS